PADTSLGGTKLRQPEEKPLQDQPSVQVRLVGQVRSGLLHRPPRPRGGRGGPRPRQFAPDVLVQVDDELRVTAGRNQDCVAPVGRQRQQRPVQELSLGPAQPPLVLLLEPPNHAAERFLRPPPVVQERPEVLLELLAQPGPELFRRGGQRLGGGQRTAGALKGLPRRRQRVLSERGDLSIVGREPAGATQV